MTIVDDKSVRQPVSTYDRFLEEALGLMFGDVRQRLTFDPLGEVVNGNNEKFSLADCWRERT